MKNQKRSTINVTHWISLKKPFVGYIGRRYEYIGGPESQHRRFVHMIHVETGKHRITSYARYLMARHLGRRLKRTETVDHVDGDRLRDEIPNLQLLSGGDNSRKHIRDSRGFIIDELQQVCIICGVYFHHRIVKKTCSSNCKRMYQSQLASIACSNGLDLKLVSKIRKMRRSGETSYSIAKRLNVARNTVMKYW